MDLCASSAGFFESLPTLLWIPRRPYRVINILSFWLRSPVVGIMLLLQFPQASEGRSSPTNTPVFSPSSFVPPSFTRFCILFSTGQVLQSALSWCSACTSVSEGVFLMYLWGEMYFTSTYFFAILFSQVVFLS